MAVTDGTVVWVGDDRAGRALHPDAEIVDLAGAFVTPAFVDTHVHVTALGLSLSGLDLGEATSLEDCLGRVQRYADAHDDSIIWAHGWDETRWPESRPPSTADLDRAAPGRAVYLARIDVHSAAASSSLRARVADLAAADGFDPQRPLRADAHHRVRTAARSSIDAGQRARARALALNHLAAHGIVAVHECGGPDIGGLDDFRELLATEHPVEVRGYWGLPVTSETEAREVLADTGAHALGGDLFVDGALGSHTAWLHEPYADAPRTCGTAYLDAAAIATHVVACTRAGIQTGFHVIGDAAMTAAMAGFRAAVDELGGPAVASLGHRIEHAEMLTRDQATDLASWGVVASVQPGFDALWGGPGALYEQRLGAERAATMNDFAGTAAAGVSLAFGSDAPVTRVEPWSMVAAAVHHRTPGRGISPRAAFSAATRGAWRAGGVRDGMAGTLAPGAPASYAIWETGELVVSAPKDSVQRWSTDPRARVPALPNLEPGAPAPVLLKSVHRGVVVHER
ncbi:amidohydrolase family protein [Rhodococcus triatomae]|nr:amidohydrolase family protein [Rhodococcus triatomae]QNG25939.1 amidohydrolase family protein [Rhodococcus triatomae]